MPPHDTTLESTVGRHQRQGEHRNSLIRPAFHQGSGGSRESFFGVPLVETRAVFFPVTRRRALPDNYAPSDLVFDFGPPLRALIVDDLRAMLQAAERDRAALTLVSGYRSTEHQAALFDEAVHRELHRGEVSERQAAECRVARLVARPGHSQHQLGTTLDVSCREIRGTIRRPFSETAACRWLAGHAHEFGFILPYTAAAHTRTGYVAEPWHIRWVGRTLATFFWKRGYLQSGYPTADDILRDVAKLLATRAALPLVPATAPRSRPAATHSGADSMLVPLSQAGAR